MKRKEVDEVASPVCDKAEEIKIMRASFPLTHTILNCWQAAQVIQHMAQLVGEPALQ